MARARLRDMWRVLRAQAVQEERLRHLERRLVNPHIERPTYVKSPARITAGRDLFLGRNALLHGGGMPWSQGQGSIRIGDGCGIGENTVLYGAGGIDIGDHVDIGPGCKLFSSRDHYGREHAGKDKIVHCFGKVTIGARVILFADVVVGPGVTIGEGAVVGAKSLVLRDVPAWTVVGGTPARVLKPRDRDEEGDRLGLVADRA